MKLTLFHSELHSIGFWNDCPTSKMMMEWNGFDLITFNLVSSIRGFDLITPIFYLSAQPEIE